MLFVNQSLQPSAPSIYLDLNCGQVHQQRSSRFQSHSPLSCGSASGGKKSPSTARMACKRRAIIFSVQSDAVRGRWQSGTSRRQVPGHVGAQLGFLSAPAPLSLFNLFPVDFLHFFCPSKKELVITKSCYADPPIPSTESSMAARSD